MPGRPDELPPGASPQAVERWRKQFAEYTAQQALIERRPPPGPTGGQIASEKVAEAMAKMEHVANVGGKQIPLGSPIMAAEAARILKVVRGEE